MKLYTVVQSYDHSLKTLTFDHATVPMNLVASLKTPFNRNTKGVDPGRSTAGTCEYGQNLRTGTSPFSGSIFIFGGVDPQNEFGRYTPTNHPI